MAETPLILNGRKCAAHVRQQLATEVTAPPCAARPTAPRVSVPTSPPRAATSFAPSFSFSTTPCRLCCDAATRTRPFAARRPISR